MLLFIIIIIMNQSVDLFQSIKLLSEILFTSTLILLLLLIIIIVIIYYYYYYESISWSFSIHQTSFRYIVYFYSNIIIMNNVIINYY